MQVETNRDTSANRPIHRLFEAVADFLSPPVACAACGYECKQRRCEKTGAVRAVEGAEVWRREMACEVEYLCPSCGESIWRLETAAYYYPIG